MNRFKDGYVAAAMLGLGLYAVGLLIILVAFLIYDAAEAWFILFFAVPALIVAVALLLWRRWGLIVGIVGGVFGLLMLSEDIDLILSTPKAFFDFAAIFFAITGLIILIIASVTGTIQYFRKTPSQQLAPWQRSAIIVVGGVLVLVALFSAALTALNTGSASASEAQGAEVITAKHTKWDVEMITASSGDVRLLVKNRDPLLHTFTIDDLDIDVALGPWSEEVIVLRDLSPGTYGFICRIFDHAADMTGVITVQ